MMFRRPAVAPLVAAEATEDGRVGSGSASAAIGVAVGGAPSAGPLPLVAGDSRSDDGSDDGLESLDSLRSSRSMESLEALPPFSPLFSSIGTTPSPKPRAVAGSGSGARRRSWRRSGSGRNEGDGIIGRAPDTKKVDGGGVEASAAGGRIRSSFGRILPSPPRRMFGRGAAAGQATAPSTPQRSGGVRGDGDESPAASSKVVTNVASTPSGSQTAPSSTASEAGEGEGEGDDFNAATEHVPRNARTPAPPSSVARIHPTPGPPSPLTPFTAATTNEALPPDDEPTPRTANGEAAGDETEDEAPPDIVHQPALEAEAEADSVRTDPAGGTAPDRSARGTASGGDADLRHALDSMGRNLEELRKIDDVPAAEPPEENVGNGGGGGYDEFLRIVASGGTVDATRSDSKHPAAVEQDAEEDANDRPSSKDVTDGWIPSDSSAAEMDDSCRCWFPQPLLAFLRRSSGVRPAVAPVHRTPPSDEANWSESLESLRANLRATIERHAPRASPSQTELLQSEMWVIEESLKRMSSLTI
ncbi:hypothetical protein ACHAWF_012730 [Thalassiosira exigua]